MKLLLTPHGPNDKVIERIPRIDGFIPRKEHVYVLICNDGKDYSHTNRTKVDMPYYKRLFTKLCKLNNIVKTVTLEVISFFEPDMDFHNKLINADFFFMAGFTSYVEHIASVYRRDDHAMTMKRMAVANKVVTNQMGMWAVCGSAVSCGTSWNMPACVSNRVLPNSAFQMLEILADGYVDYQSCSGPHGITVTDDLKAWHITSGTGLIIVTNDRQQCGQAFVCGRKTYETYQAKCVTLTQKVLMQLARLNSMVSEYRIETAYDSARWRLSWGSGNIQFESDCDWQERDESGNLPSVKFKGRGSGLPHSVTECALA